MHRHGRDTDDVLFGVLVMRPELSVTEAVTGHHIGIPIRPGQHEDIRQRVRAQIVANILDGLPAAAVAALIVVVIDEGDADPAGLQTPALSERNRAIERAEGAAQEFFGQLSAVLEL